METIKGKLPEVAGYYWVEDNKDQRHIGMVNPGQGVRVLSAFGTAYFAVPVPPNFEFLGPIDPPHTCQYLLADIRDCELCLVGPFMEEQAWEEKAQSIRDEQNPETDFIFGLWLENGVLVCGSAPGEDRKDEKIQTGE